MNVEKKVTGGSIPQPLPFDHHWSALLLSLSLSLSLFDHRAWRHTCDIIFIFFIKNYNYYCCIVPAVRSSNNTRDDSDVYSNN